MAVKKRVQNIIKMAIIGRAKKRESQRDIVVGKRREGVVGKKRKIVKYIFVAVRIVVSHRRISPYTYQPYFGRYSSCLLCVFFYFINL